MYINLYTRHHCADSDATRRALAEAGVPFVEFCVVGDGQETLPLVTIMVNGEMVVWQGHRPDLLSLLKELVRC